jgi:hypothetical protein
VGSADSSVRGVAVAACLVNDPEGPLYLRAARDQIADLAQPAIAPLTPVDVQRLK